MAFFFKIHISYGAFRYVFSMESGGKISKPSSVLSAEGGTCCPAPPNVNQRQKKKVFIICIKKFLSALVTGSFQVSAGLSWMCEVSGGHLQLHVQ